MALFAGKLKKELEARVSELADCQTALSAHIGLVKTLREQATDEGAAHRQTIAALTTGHHETVEGLRLRHAEELAGLRGQMLIMDQDAAKWRAIRPVGKWLRVTSVYDDTGQEVHIWQPVAGQFAEGSNHGLFTARMPSTMRDLFPREENER